MATRTLTIPYPSNSGNSGCRCGSNCVTYYSGNPVNTCCRPVVNNCPGNCNPCAQCDSVVLMPLNPAILVAPATYISAAGVPAANGQLSVSFDDAVLVNPAAPLTGSDFRALCTDDYVRLILVTA